MIIELRMESIDREQSQFSVEGLFCLYIQLLESLFKLLMKENSHREERRAIAFFAVNGPEMFRPVFLSRSISEITASSSGVILEAAEKVTSSVRINCLKKELIIEDRGTPRRSAIC